MAERLSILTPASDLGVAWAEAVMRAAAERGWRVGHEAEPDPGPRSLRLTTDIAPDEPPSGWIVLADDPAALWAAEARRLSEDHPPRDILLLTSRRLACAARLAALGAPVLPAGAMEIDLPGLGRIGRGEPAGESARVQDGALALYDQLPPPVGAGAVWGADLFSYPVGKGFDGGQPDMDLTGRARIIVHGPHLELPPGVWRAEVRFAIDPRGAPIRFRFDWGVGDDMVVSNPLIRNPGLYRLSLTRRWLEPGAAQVRIWLMQGVFDGRFEFQGCTVERVADDAPVSSPVSQPADGG